MRLRANPDVGRELERDIEKLGRGIREIEDVLLHKNDPVLKPWLERFQKRLEGIEYQLDMFEDKTDIQIRLLLQQRLDLRRILGFNELEESLPGLRSALEQKEKRLDEHRKRAGETQV